MVIPPIPPAYTCLLIKNPQQIWLFLTLQKKVEGINTPPPFHICNIYDVILTYKKDITLTHTYSAS